MDEQFFNEARQEYANAGIDTFEIYQLKDDKRLAPYLYEPLGSVTQGGHRVTISDYNPVYIAALSEFDEQENRTADKLEAIYETFNVNRPADFEGHSLSVSDVVVIKEIEEKAKAYYVDNFGFAEVPEFLDAANTSGKCDMEMG